MKKSKLLKTLAVFAISAGAAIGCFAMVGCNKKGGDGEQQQQQQPEEQKPSIDLSTLTYETTATVDIDASNLTAQDYTAETDISGMGIVYLMGNVPGEDGKTKNMTVDGSKTNDTEGKSYTQRIKTNGGGAVDNRCVKLKLEKAAKIVVVAKSGSSTEDRKVVIRDTNYAAVEGQEMAAPAAVKGTDANVGTLYAAKGTWYIASSASSISIFAIRIYYAV